MNKRLQGLQGEDKARDYLRSKGITNLQQLDWIIKKDGRYTIIEVKYKELFKPPPFAGAGLDISQVKLRTQLYKELGLDTLLIVFETGTDNVYYQLLSKLEQTDYFDTKNKIRIYDIKNFRKDKTNATPKIL